MVKEVFIGRNLRRVPTEKTFPSAAERRILAPGLTVLDFYARPVILAEEDKAPRGFPSSTQERFYVKPGNSFM